MKNCPLCTVEMEEKVLDDGLPAFTCPVCHGIWISAVTYQDWLTIDRMYPLAEVDIERQFDIPYPITDHDRAIICPDCGRILRRYQVWPNINFNLDRCSHCYGIWFDNNEWQPARRLPYRPRPLQRIKSQNRRQLPDHHSRIA